MSLPLLLFLVRLQTLPVLDSGAWGTEPDCLLLIDFGVVDPFAFDLFGIFAIARIFLIFCIFVHVGCNIPTGYKCPHGTDFHETCFVRSNSDSFSIG